MKTNDKNKTVLTDTGQRGAALVVAIFSMLLITVVAVAFIANGMVSGNISQNSRQQAEAFFISEAGLTHAAKLATQAGPAQFTSILQAGDGVANTGDELSTRPSAQTPIPGAGISFGAGSYRVLVSDDPADTDGNPNVDSNQKIVITSIGIGRDGATATTEVIFAASSTPAIIVNGPLLINGNPVISGSAGQIHANGAITISGGPCVSQNISSTSTISVGGSLGGVSGSGCSGAGVSRPNQPIMTPPTWNIQADFLSRADYIMGTDGKVTTQTGAVIHNSSASGNDWNLGGGGKWTWDPGSGKWIHGGGSLPANKTWYSAGNMELGSDFGTAGSPVTATFIAEGFITVSANPYVRKYLDNKFAFMAGTDLVISGNPATGTNSSEGIHYAGHQIKFNGNPRINGVVIARNLVDTNSPVCACNPVPWISGGRMEINGNPTVTYNGDLLDSTARFLSWREVRN